MSLFPRLLTTIRSIFDRFLSTLRRSPFSASGFFEDGVLFQARVLDLFEPLHTPVRPLHPFFRRATAIPLLVAIASGIGLVWFFNLIHNLSAN
ncbi:MAG: hypothetical protein IT270_06955 [Saprospiraceae bacterium]|nr:hypothetical protein [Saprospiraceae bacterium]